MEVEFLYKEDKYYTIITENIHSYTHLQTFHIRPSTTTKPQSSYNSTTQLNHNHHTTQQLS